MQGLSTRYRVWLCDVWGVVHDGTKAIPSAVQALVKHRENGGTVILITNAPRPSFNVVAQLDALGVTPAAYDDIVSSGDVTRTLMAKAGDIYHMGPATDVSLYENVQARRVALTQAKAVVCTGFFEDRPLSASAYLADFEVMRARGLPMICANPDKVVRIGSELVLCAGTLAEAYASLGGEILMAGKPFAPIYELALQKAGNPERDHVMVIGDGPETDVQGAQNQRLACYFVAGGINIATDSADLVRLEFPQVNFVGSSAELYWR